MISKMTSSSWIPPDMLENAGVTAISIIVSSRKYVRVAIIVTILEMIMLE